MDDMSEAFKEYRKAIKKEKKNRAEKNLKIIEQSEFKYRTYMNGTVLFNTPQGTLCFYPTVNKFMFKNKVYCGDADKVLSFIRNMNKKLDDKENFKWPVKALIK